MIKKYMTLLIILVVFCSISLIAYTQSCFFSSYKVKYEDKNADINFGNIDEERKINYKSTYNNSYQIKTHIPF